MESDLPPSSAPRKVKFAPKGPPPRRKPLQPKSEVVSNGGDDGEDDETTEALLRKVKDHLTRRRPQAEKKSSVQVVFAHGVASSTSLKTYGIAKEGTDNRSDDIGLGDSSANYRQDALSLPSTTSTDWDVESSQNATDSLYKQKKRQYKEPWDYHHSYYPVTLPLRRPYSGDPEVLDEEEFGEARAFSDYDESAIHSASDLGLMEQDAGVKMLFVQLPVDLPFGQRPSSGDCKEASGFLKLPGNASASLTRKERTGNSMPGGTVASARTKGKEIHGNSASLSGSAKGKDTVDISSSSAGTNFSEEVCSLEELAAGHMGKMLVYKSGAVKLRLGDILYDVSPGSDCMFAQDIVAINTSDKECCIVGEVSKRAVLTPDIDALLN